VVSLGGGRQVESDSIDYAVGLSDMLPLGTRVERGQPIARVHASREDAARRAAVDVLQATTLGAAPTAQPLLLERVTA
jgi:thymidine phosphorylase